MTPDKQLGRVGPFTPLRPVPRRRLILRTAIAPLLWLVAFVVVAIVLNQTRAIELGLLIAFASVLLSLVAMLLLRAGRNRERRAHELRR